MQTYPLAKRTELSSHCHNSTALDIFPDCLPLLPVLLGTRGGLYQPGALRGRKEALQLSPLCEDELEHFESVDLPSFRLLLGLWATGNGGDARSHTDHTGSHGTRTRM